MPAIVIYVVRQIIIIGIQLGIFWLIDKYVIPVLGKAIGSVMTFFGVNEETANDIVANEFLTTLSALGLSAVLAKAKLPLKVVDMLGFTKKGWNLRKLKPEVEAIVARAKSQTKVSAPTASLVSKDVVEVTAQAKGLSFAKVNDVTSLILKVALAPVGVLYMIAQYIDYGNWNSGAYQSTFQKILGIFGLEPDRPLPKSGVLSSDVWTKVYTTYKDTGVTAMNDPYKNMTVLFSRQNLIDLVDKVAAQITLETGGASLKQVMGATQALMIFSKTSTQNNSAPTSSSSSSTPAKTSSPVASSTSVKVFTGVVSQGTVGGDFLFEPRPDDLIENMGELQQAVNNNIAPYLASLLGQVVYEIKVVSSVISNGVRLTGTTQRIQSGTYAGGAPKYKTVTNKFAVADMFLKRDGGSRTKLTSIILGPVNAITFQPTSGDLVSLSAAIPKNILTSSTDDIDTVVSGTPTLLVAPASQDMSISSPSIGYTFVYDGYLGSVSFNTATVDRLRKEVASGTKTVEQAMAELKSRHLKDYGGNNPEITGEDSWANQNPNHVATAFSIASDKIRALLTTGGTFEGTPQQEVSANETVQDSAQSAPAQQNQAAKASTLPAAALAAKTLFEFYGAIGKQLPSLEERGRLYQQLGLGQAAFYTGTAEQNTKLLYKLQGDPL